MPKKPVSPQRLAANRANAAKSTGPRTPEGKARSSQNARKHSFLAANFAVVRLEDLNEVAHLRADLIATYQPVNSQELFAIERLALAQQSLNRCSRMEVGMYTSFLNESLDPEGRPLRLLTGELIQDIDVQRAQNRNFILYEGFSRLNRQSRDILVFLRIQAQTERLYRRAVEELERLRRLRKELPTEANFEPEPEESKPVEAPQTKPAGAPRPVRGASPAAPQPFLKPGGVPPAEAPCGSA